MKSGLNKRRKLQLLRCGDIVWRLRAGKRGRASSAAREDTASFLADSAPHLKNNRPGFENVSQTLEQTR